MCNLRNLMKHFRKNIRKPESFDIFTRKIVDEFDVTITLSVPLISEPSAMVKASPNNQYKNQQEEEQQQQLASMLIQNYYKDVSDVFEEEQEILEAAGEPDKSINIVEDDIATDLEEVSSFLFIYQINIFVG